MQNNILLAAAASAALLALSACNNDPQTVNTYDPQAEALRNAPPVTELPPAVIANRTYRCTDNSLFYVDFYDNDTAAIRTSRDGARTTLTAAGGNPPFTAEGYSVSANADNVRITAPGKNNLSCHV